MKKCTSFLLSVVGLVGILTGCTPSNKTNEDIVVWHWMNDRQTAFLKLAEQYKEENGINVTFKLFSPPDIYSQKVIAAARAGNLPDIFGILGEKKTISSFVKAGHILNLTPYIQENNRKWQNSFYPQALNVTEFKNKNSYEAPEGFYGIPIDMTVVEFLYNKELFKKAGLDPNKPPSSFEQFIDYAKIIKDKLSVDGFTCGWGEGWLINAIAIEWAINLMGEEKFLQTIKGEVPYTDAQWIEVFSLFEKIKNANILSSNITTMINKEAEDSFSKNQAVFSFNGSWSINVYKQLAPDLQYAFFPLPEISKKFPVKIWGGAGSSFMVNAHSKKTEKVVSFLKWLTSPKQQKFLVKETNNLPAIKGCTKELSPVMLSLVDDFGILTHRNIWPYNESSPVIEVTIKSLQQIIMGLKTPQEAALDIQSVKEREMRK